MRTNDIDTLIFEGDHVVDSMDGSLRQISQIQDHGDNTASVFMVDGGVMGLDEIRRDELLGEVTIAPETIRSTQDRGDLAMIVEGHGTGIRLGGDWGRGSRPKASRTVRLPETDVKVRIQLGVDIEDLAILFIDTEGVPMVDDEVALRVFINNGVDPDHTRYTPLREVKV